MTTDPVCGMSIDPATAAEQFEYAGRTYYFCSGNCLGKFKADPARYVTSGGGAMAKEHHGDRRAGGNGVSRWVFWGFMLIAGFFLIAEHRAHVVQYLPFLLLLACPLMHLFHGHGGHGGHGGKEEPEKKSADGKKPDSDKKHGGDRH